MKQKQAEQQIKLPYSTPRLVAFGPVATLTAGASGKSNDGQPHGKQR